jgi:hypothetical protein
MATECCCLDVDPSDSPTAGHTEERRARKEHTCCECGEAILKGERYEHVTGCWDGHWDTYRTCLPCAAIRRDFFPCGWYYGQMAEDFRECHGWDYRDVPEDGGPDPVPAPDRRPAWS